MKISILGTNGFLSSSIGKYFENRKCELEVYGLEPPVTHLYHHFHEMNLLKDSIDAKKLYDSDLIIYAIGAGIQSNLKESANLIYNLNTTVPVKLCNELKTIGFTGTVVSFGSIFEIGEISVKRKFTEHDILTSSAIAPSDYVVSKRMFSRFVDSYHHQFVHWHFILPTIYGVGENPKRLIPYTVNAVLTGEVPHFTAGNQMRQYIHVDEIPMMLEMAVKKHLPSGIYNVEGKEILTVREIVSSVYDYFNKSLSEESFGSASRSDVGMEYLALDGSKLRQMTGFVPTVKILDVIKQYILQ